jgi:hypothetical protein
MCQHTAELIVLLLNCSPTWGCGWYHSLYHQTRDAAFYWSLIRLSAVQDETTTQICDVVYLFNYQQPLFSYENTIVLGIYTTFAKVHFSEWSVSESSRKTQFFWATTPCRLVDRYRHFGGIYCPPSCLAFFRESFKNIWAKFWVPYCHTKRHIQGCW